MTLPMSWDLPEEIQLRFGQRSLGKQRAMVAQGHLLLVLHRLPGPGAETREAILFWRKPTGEWECTARGTGLKALRQHVQDYDEAEDRLRAQYQAAQVAEDYFRLLESMAPLLRSAKHLHATLQAAREGIPGDRELIDLRDWAYDVERSVELLHQSARNALDFSIARKAEEQARISTKAAQSAHRLNLLAAVFFPLTAIASVFGMNLSSGLARDSVAAFWCVCAVAVGLGFATREWVLDRRRKSGRSEEHGG